MEYTLNISKDKYYKAALKVVNFVLNLTDYELDIMVIMLNYNIKVLTKDTRKLLREKLGKDVNNINNYIKRLKDKKVLVKTPEGLEINPKIVESLSDKEIKVKFNVYTSNNNINSN